MRIIYLGKDIRYKVWINSFQCIFLLVTQLISQHELPKYNPDKFNQTIWVYINILAVSK